MPIITLTTDFGTRDGYVGAVKGVIARLVEPTVRQSLRFVDVAHDVPRGDVAHAAWVVATACREFPEDSIHLVVVDPGVGGPRQAVAVQTPTCWYVGPDNGVLAYVIRPDDLAHRLTVPEDASATFHGRDVFAPAVARIANNETRFGRRVELHGVLPWGARPAGEGRVVHVDLFGNLVSDLPRDEAGLAVAVAGRRLSIVRTYEDVAAGELLAYVGSAGTIEIAVRDGRADRALDAPRGTRIVPVAAGSEFR